MSIVVTVILMLIMTLIVLAMSQNANREQRQALDRQLSDQAFYNAESGINDVAYFLYKYPDAPIDVTNCSDFLSFAKSKEPTFSNQLDGSTGTNKYSCVLYNKAPLTLEFQKIGVAESKVVPIQVRDNTGNPVTLSSLTISWDDAENPSGPISGACSFNSGSPALPASCGFGGIRAELMNPSITREAMSKLSFIAFLLPNASSGSNLSILGKPYPENQGVISATKCDSNPGPRRCTISITDINLPSIYLHIRSLYRPTNITVSGSGVSGPVRLSNAQVMIDVTGKANDVLRRVQVRAPANAQYTYPEFGLQTKESICKLISVRPNSAQATTSNGNTCPID